MINIIGLVALNGESLSGSAQLVSSSVLPDELSPPTTTTYYYLYIRPPIKTVCITDVDIYYSNLF